MTSIRYAGRPPDERRNREVEAVQRQIWTRAVTVVFETDPEVIAAVLPPPLSPAEVATARLRIAGVDMGTGLDGDPPLVHCHRHETARLVRAVDGELKLMDSPLDPIADLPVRGVVSMEYAELAGTQRGEIVGRVPAEDLLPFVHQRYDDLSVLGAKS